MMTQWTVNIVIDEQDGATRAEANLRAPSSSHLVGHGLARRNPNDVNVPGIGDELAAARALSGLAHQLLDAAAHDIESMTHQAPNLSV